MKILSIIFLFLLVSCKNHDAGKHKLDGIENHINGFKKNKLECTPNDTLTDKISVKYIELDSVFYVKISIDNYDTILPYKFNCSIPSALVPTIYSVAKGVICLRRGYGWDFAQFVVCYIKENRMFVKAYEIALETDLKNDKIIYQNYDSLDQICIENIKTGSRQVINIPSKIKSRHIYETIIKNNRLTLRFSDDKKFVIPYVSATTRP